MDREFRDKLTLCGEVDQVLEHSQNVLYCIDDGTMDNDLKRLYDQILFTTENLQLLYERVIKLELYGQID